MLLPSLLQGLAESPAVRLLVYPGGEHYPAAHEVEVVPLPVAAQLVRDRVGGAK